MNWSALIEQLCDTGLSVSAIAAAVGAPPSTISDIAHGRTKQPRGSLALALNALLAERNAIPKAERHVA